MLQWERTTILPLLERVRLAELPESISREIVIVDDYSKDGTRDLLKVVDKPNCTSCLPSKKTWARALPCARGLKPPRAGGSFYRTRILEYNPRRIRKTAAPHFGWTRRCGFRLLFLDDARAPDPVLFQSLGNKFLTFASNIFTNINLTDMETCYKMLRKEIIDKK